MTDSVDWKDEYMMDLELLKAPENWGEMTGPFFHLQLPDTPPQGPFHAKELKDFVADINLPPGTMVRDAKGIGAWTAFYEHPFFQRRKPQVLAEGSATKAKEYYLLVEGTKLGPYATQEIQEMLDQKEIILTDLISEEGKDWVKLHSLNEFDRREHTQNSLPESPGWEVFKDSNEETRASLDNPDLETSALASLAFLENVKAGKSPIQESELNHGNQEEKEAEVIAFPKDQASSASHHDDELSSEGSSKTLQYGTYGLITFLLLGSVFFFFSQNQSPTNIAIEEVGEMREEATADLRKSKRPRARSYKSPSLRPKVKPRVRKPASITETESFEDNSKRRLQDDVYEESYPAEEDNYYDDPATDEYDYDNGQTPVQQDEVRKKLDKNIIDSQEDYYDEDERYEYDDAYNTSYGDAPQIEPAQVWGNEREPAADQQILDGEDAYPEELAPEADNEFY